MTTAGNPSLLSGNADPGPIEPSLENPAAVGAKPAVRRLILAVAAFFPDSYGGAERQAHILAEALGRLGVDVTLVAPTTAASAPLHEETAFGRIERLHVGHYPNAGGRFFYDFLAWTVWFRRRFGSAGYAGVPIYVFHARLHAVGPALAAIRRRAPLLIKLGGGGDASDFVALRAKRFLYGRLVQSLLLRRADAFIANGSQIVRDLEALGVDHQRIAAFPNGVVLRDRADVERSLAERAGNRFIYAGRLIRDKRVGVLAEAVRSLAAADPEPRLTLLGDGPERERLLGEQGGVTDGDRLSLPGYTEEVYPHLLASDFFVSASLREGQSNAMLEAMSAGVIPIVADASGVDDVVEHGRTGFVVRDPDAAAFTEAMRAAMAMPPDERRSMALAARDFAERHIGIDAIAARTIAVLDGIRSRPAGVAGGLREGWV